jgi:catechol 2,3-dioxygenase-like lactoylglutathione lyase family enzyme
MIDHTGIKVSDIGRSTAFYRAALAPIGYLLLFEFPAEVTGGDDVAGFGVPPKPDFWIAQGTPNRPPVHIALRGRARAGGCLLRSGP